jgi:DNA ligase (NAD+)
LKEYRDVIVDMEGFGEKSYEKLLAAAENAKKTTADRFLASLGVPEVGSATAKAIARAFGNNWNKIAGADKESLSDIEGVGPVIAKLYTEWFSDPGNAETAENVFSEIYLEGTREGYKEGYGEQSAAFPGAAADTAAKVSGKIFVITGSLNGYKSRDLLAEKIEDLGGKVTGSVSKNTDYLINNDAMSGSAKNKKARELGVAIITEEEFEELIRGDSG